MPAFIASLVNKILVIGPSFGIGPVPGYDLVIFNGGFFHTERDIDASIAMVKALPSNAVYIAGRSDYLLTKHNRYLAKWMMTQYNAAIIEFSSRSLIVVDGGIPASIRTKSDLCDSLEISFASMIDNEPWHKSYDGRLGYVISNGPLSKRPQHYAYSMQLGNIDGIIYAQEADTIGLKHLFTVNDE